MNMERLLGEFKDWNGEYDAKESHIMLEQNKHFEKCQKSLRKKRKLHYP